MFNMDGQGWGLAPVSTHAIVERDFAPVRRSYTAAMRHAGALRIDHAMGLFRLFWIPAGASPADGAYVIYPMERTVEVLAEVSRANGTLVIGEDLGILPVGFRDAMERASVLGYRVWYFERHDHGFVPPEHWPRDALACVGSHDTPTLAGWWTGRDIEARAAIGVSDPDRLARDREGRTRERAQALELLRERFPMRNSPTTTAPRPPPPSTASSPAPPRACSPSSSRTCSASPNRSTCPAPSTSTPTGAGGTPPRSTR
jgi:4-alpha-glucanotransferase